MKRLLFFTSWIVIAALLCVSCTSQPTISLSASDDPPTSPEETIAPDDAATGTSGGAPIDLESLLVNYAFPLGSSPSLNEETPFDPIACSLYDFRTAIRNAAGDEEQLSAWFEKIKLPLSQEDIHYIANNPLDTEKFYNIIIGGKPCTVRILANRWPTDYAFIFVEDEEKCTLIDCLEGFGQFEIVTDQGETNSWLIGREFGHGTGHESSETRWYNLKNRCVDVRYHPSAHQVDYFYASTIRTAVNMHERDYGEGSVRQILEDSHVVLKTGYRFYVRPSDESGSDLPFDQRYTYGQYEIYQYDESTFSLSLIKTKQYENIDPTVLDFFSLSEMLGE